MLAGKSNLDGFRELGLQQYLLLALEIEAVLPDLS